MTNDVDTSVEQHDEHHDMNIAVIVGYLLALTAATSATLLIQDARFWGPTTNVLFTLTISVCKAALVVGFFMHYKYEKMWKYFLTIPPLVLGVVLICALLPDIVYETYPRVGWH